MVFSSTNHICPINDRVILQKNDPRCCKATWRCGVALKKARAVDQNEAGFGYVGQA